MKLSPVYGFNLLRIVVGAKKPIKSKRNTTKETIVEQKTRHGRTYAGWQVDGARRRGDAAHMIHFHLQQLAPYDPSLHHKAWINIHRTNHNEDGSRKHIVLREHAHLCLPAWLSSPCHAHGCPQHGSVHTRGESWAKYVVERSLWGDTGGWRT
jgi:hypothetical protein